MKLSRQRNYMAYSRDRKENKEGGVEHVSREWIKYVCLNKPTTSVPRLQEGRDKEKRKEKYIYIIRIVCELIQAMQQRWSEGGAI